MDPAVGEHVQPQVGSSAERDEPPISPGVYRVVGRDPDGGLTLLRCTDTDGTRINTGEIRHVDRDSLDSFEPAPDPDAPDGTLAYVWQSVQARQLSSGIGAALVTMAVLGTEPRVALAAAGVVLFGVAIVRGPRRAGGS